LQAGHYAEDSSFSCVNEEELALPIVTAHIVVRGQIQGIGFRKYVKDCADELKLSGTVQNQPDGDVNAMAVGEREVIEQLVAKIEAGNGLTKITKVNVKWREWGEPAGEFKIVKTSFW